MPRAKKNQRVRPVKFNWQLILILFTLAFLAISIISLNNKISLNTSAKSVLPTLRDEIRICFNKCRQTFGDLKNQGLCIANCNKFKPSDYPTSVPGQPDENAGPTSTVHFPTQTQ